MGLSQHPLLYLGVSFALGIIFAGFGGLSITVHFVVAGISSILSLYLFATDKRSQASLSLAVTFLFLGALVGLIEQRSIRSDRVRRLYDEGAVASGEPVEITGVIERAPEPRPDGFSVSLNVEKIRIRDEERNATGVVSLFGAIRDKAIRAEYESLELRHGARVRVMTTLDRTERFRNPGASSFAAYLEQRGLDATGVIKSPLLIERLNDERVFLPLAWLYDWRHSLTRLVYERFSGETAGVLLASLLGNRYFLSKSSAEAFREGGTFHVLVISGLHISFIGFVALIIMRRVTRRREWQFAASVALLWSYTLAVGAEASVVRAALMFTVVALAPVLHRKANSLNALGGAGFALLIWRPSELFDPSFQLTFLSVLSIVVIAWPLLVRLQQVGVWRPTRETPSPPSCRIWWRSVGELLHWSEREWQKEMKHSPWRCRLFKNRYAARLEKWHLQRTARYVACAVIVSLAVQLMLLPLLVLYFHRLSLASILLNIIVGVLMASLSFCGVAALLVAEFSSTLATPLLALTEGINWLTVHSVDPFEGSRLGSIRMPEYTGWASILYGIYFLPLVTLTIMLARWNPFRPLSSTQTQETSHSLTRIASGTLSIAIVLVIWHPFSARSPDGRLHVDFLDVGQGDAALVTMPNGTTVLVDGGGRPAFDDSSRYQNDDGAAEPFELDRRSIGEAVVSEYLWWRGLDRVDYIVATHADADHIDGLVAVARNFKVRSALVAREPQHDSEYIKFVTSLRKAGVPVHVVARGDSLHVGGVTLDVLWPVRRSNVIAPSGNDDSIVIRLRYGERVFLMTGDVESRAEGILSRLPNELKCDVVKVAHHGSKTSSIERFVNATRPSLAVISVGLFSSYGHPHKDVVDRWRACGAKVMTTGQHGTISISTDGSDLAIETFVR